MVAFDTLTGNDTSLAIENVLGGRRCCISFRLILLMHFFLSLIDALDVPFTFDTHAAMEKKLKLNTR